MNNMILFCLSNDNYIGIFQVIATILVGIATIFTYFKITEISKNSTIQAARLNDESNRFNKLNGDLDQIVEYTIQYPYFEDEDYTKNQYRLNIDSSDSAKRESALRYELFAIMNFNFIEDLYKFYNGDLAKMSKQTNYIELIESHAEYWKYKIIEKKERGYELIRPIVNGILKIDPTI
jgi:hypothetical protein